MMIATYLLSNCHECYIREVRSISKQYFEIKFESTFFNVFKPFTKNFSTILIQQSKNFLQRNLFCSQSVKIYGLRHTIVSFHNLQMHIHINDQSCRLVSEFIIWIMQIMTHYYMHYVWITNMIHFEIKFLNFGFHRKN